MSVISSTSSGITHDGENATAASQRPKRGLVLEGGGAKGAYAFGWLRAFREHGVVFDAVAGTSVGAINAALWATDQLDAGGHFWDSMTQEGVYPYRRPKILFLPLGLLRALFRLISERASRKGTRIFLDSAAFFGVVVGPILTLLIYLNYRYLLTPAAWDEVVIGLWLTGITFVASIIVLFPLLIEALGFSILRSAPLQENLGKYLNTRPVQVPTYATVAYEAEVWDPNDLVGYGAVNAPVALYYAKTKYLPKYIPIHILSDEERVATVLASASLPYGIVPSVDVGGHFFVDGGVADNLPLYPLVTAEQCDVLVILHLRPYAKSEAGPDSESYRQYWRRIDYLLRACQLTRDEVIGWTNANLGTQMHGEYIKRSLEFRDPPTWPTKIISIAPKKNLGGLRDGTLNLSRTYTQPLAKMGYDDAQEMSDEFWSALSATVNI